MMMKLSIKNQKPLVKVGKRGNYSEAERQALLDLPKDSNLSLELRALSAKWNRDFDNVRRRYYKLQEDKNKLVEKEITKRESEPMHMRTVEVNKYDSKENAWSEWETDLVMQALSQADNKSKAAKEVSELLENRTSAAVISRYNYIQSKRLDKNNEPILPVLEKEAAKAHEPKLADTVLVEMNELNNLFFPQSKEKLANPFFIPEKTTNVFLEEVSVPMYKSLDGSLHEKASDGVKANVRFILDSMPDKDAEDKVLHQWFVENKSKVEYLTNLNVEELW